MVEGRILVGDIPMHYRIGGSGPPVLLLHPSPSTGKSLLPLARQLEDCYTVICPDTSGYGESPMFESSSYQISDYATQINLFVKTLGYNKVALYGSATGAQIAIRYGNMFPQEVAHLFLDNAAHFEKEEVAKILLEYFPDLTPRLDGAHLAKIWEVTTHLFKYFPWCFKTDAHKLNIPQLPVAVYHNIAIEYMTAGKDYAHAYKAAFAHEKVQNIQTLQVPATILRWQGSILKKYTDRIFEYELPAHVGSAIIPAPADQRFTAIKKCMQDHYQPAGDFQEGPLGALIENHVRLRFRRWSALSDLGPAPALKMDGSHLLEAFQIIKAKTDNKSAEQIQSRVVDWYNSVT